MYADWCCCHVHLVWPQPQLSCEPTGAAAQQRNAHSFPTRPSPNPRSCTFLGLLQCSLTQFAPCAITCRWMLAQSLANQHLSWLISTADIVACPSPALPQTQSICRPMVVAALPSLVSPQDQLSHSQQGSPAMPLPGSLLAWGLMYVSECCSPIWHDPSHLDIHR